MSNITLKTALKGIALFASLFFFPALTYSQCTDLFFSEYAEGSGNNKCLEIFNPTDFTVTLDDVYTIQIFSNGSEMPSSTIALTGSIAPGDVFVICNSAATFASSSDQTSGAISFNGNDVPVLRYDGGIIDAIGQIGNSGTFGSNVTQIRDASVTEGDTDPTDDFDFGLEWTSVNGGNDISTLGSHTFDGCGGGSPACSEIFISEYVEGSSNNKYLEIYNPTGNTVDLANYELRRYANGTDSPTSASLSEGGMLAPGQVVVFQNSSANEFTGTAFNLGNLTHNGDDAYDLYNTATQMVVDIFGVIGEDPGSAWTGAGGYSTRDKTLRRKAAVQGGVTENPIGGEENPEDFVTLTTEWDLFDQNDVSGLGSHASTCIVACPTVAEVFINEFHYDNVGSDVGEFVEVAVANAAGVDLSNVFLTLYNGNGGVTYNLAMPLSDFTMGTNDGTFTYYFMDIAGIQNGAPDGFALNCGDEAAFQFLSYEGVIEDAATGPAEGQTSTDVGVAEINASEGSSIQLINGEWELTGVDTKGEPNEVIMQTCMIGNVTIEFDGRCNGADAEFRVRFDVEGGSGNYEAFDADNPSIVYGSFNGSATNGNFFIQCDLVGPTSVSSLNVKVRDAGNDGCEAAEAVVITIPDCPIANCANQGDLIITEIMQNPSAVFDSDGEYFEVFNTTMADIDMLGYVIKDADTESFVITSSVVVPAGGSVVFGRNMDFATNGGVEVDYEYENFFLSNSSDEVIIECGVDIIDQVFYDNGATFPDPNGASMSLDPESYNSVANDDGANWCEASTPFGDGDLGTPGAINTACCEAPTAICEDVLVEIGPDGSVTVDPFEVGGNSIVECGLESLVLSTSVFGCDDIGTETVTLTVTDVKGNTDACTATLTIVEGEALPMDFQEFGIGGAEGEAGFFPCSGEEFQITSNGFATSNSDKAYTAFTEVCGNVEIIARVADISAIGQAGIFIRESSDAGSKKVELSTQLTTFVRGQFRMSTNANEQTGQVLRYNSPWLRIIRTNNSFILYTSNNGSYWRFAFFKNVSMSDCVQVGMFTESINPVTFNTATFDNVSITSHNNAVFLTEDIANVGSSEADLGAQDFNVFPNPAQTELSVRMDAYIGLGTTLSIYNNLGQLMKQVEIEEVQNPVERLDLSGLQNGMYLIELRNGDKRSTKRFIVNNK